MNEIVKIIGKFFKRDFLYILGGTCVIISILYLFNKLPKKFENYELIFIISVGYVLGYSIQELMSIIRITTSAMPEKITKLNIWLFERFTMRIFNLKTQLNPIKLNDDYFFVVSKIDEKSLEEFHRIIDLKHIGIGIGANWLVCSIILFIKTFISYSGFNLFISITVFFVSLVLIALGWIFTIMQIEFIILQKNALISQDKESTQILKL